MAGETGLAADHPGHALQRPERRGKAGGLGTGDKDLHQLLLLVGFQPWFTPGPACGPQGVFAALDSLAVPAQDRLAADLGTPRHFRLGKAFFQQP
jgi:hypothetical protein